MRTDYDQKRRQAKALFLDSKGVERIDVIAEAVGVSRSTVYSWKKRLNWDEALVESTRTSPEIPCDVQSKLTEKQYLFCLKYIQSFNATQAYMSVYGCKRSTATVEGHRILGNPNVSAAISILKKAKIEKIQIDESDVLQMYVDVIMADITDYVSFGSNSDQGTDSNYILLKDSEKVDGRLVTEIRLTKDGPVVKLADKLKALEWLASYLNMVTEEEALKVKVLREKLGGSDTEADYGVVILPERTEGKADEIIVDEKIKEEERCDEL